MSMNNVGRDVKLKHYSIAPTYAEGASEAAEDRR